MTRRVDEILSWYEGDDAQTLANLRRMLEQGRTGGTGKLVDPAGRPGLRARPCPQLRPQPRGLRPALPRPAGARRRLQRPRRCRSGPARWCRRGFASELPLILKCNSGDSLYVGADPEPALTATVEDAVRLGCAAVGFTIYPGSAARNRMYESLRSLATDAAYAGLPVVVWSYPRGSGVSEQGRDRARRRRVCRSPRLPARRPHRQGQAADRHDRERLGPQGATRRRGCRWGRWPTG